MGCSGAVQFFCSHSSLAIQAQTQTTLSSARGRAGGVNGGADEQAEDRHTGARPVHQ